MLSTPSFTIYLFIGYGYLQKFAKTFGDQRNGQISSIGFVTQWHTFW